MARPKSEDKKQALLEAATAAFAQSGIAASTSAIARSAGVAEGTLFRYFATKDELLNELYLAIKLRLVRTMIAGLDPDEKRPKENARNIWNSYIDWGVRNPMEPSHDPQRAREIIALGFEAMWHALHEADAK
ncbi:TPA: TetR/AcrR family transcriptional regulator [Klebsiella pneumoniae]|uniref:TetR/AcrR family transcriptional regulator n=1 Tax=Klebsiella pneumoniae TaxID=573 RepID=UPI0024B88479|nr:TetR/AcrR family transcriptional regulator [Klebsiella pneumoniae]WHR11402.1 TetR/AcrR family transcriptional regulator [Klebsiella pneumoniae]HBS2867092.1 TetR/AcrR family transcriptional regulator [Klebsiella pneumoniae]HBS2916632.1 TetR/AcrR family transcriptional regulator [Klebsiella pneumoniae]HBS2938079.1 TetR/AcrR family transcriptional regulator [Klebsiella pneumoniae]HBS2955074.1 TetR/AcrR family transcriptional regulator [Klebsiella pneumoniae]